MTKLTQQAEVQVEKFISAAVKTLKEENKKQLKMLEERIVKLETELAEKSKQLKILQQPKETAEIESPWTSIVKKTALRSEDSLRILNEISGHIKEMNSKEKNIIIFGLEESLKEEITEKKKDDEKEVKSIFQTLNIQDCEVNGMFRLKNQEHAKTVSTGFKEQRRKNKIMKE